MVTWILALLTSLEPNAPWKDTYESSAKTIALVATDSPLYAGADGPRKTAALLVSVAWFESRFQPNAEGDCKVRDKDKRCVSQPQSLCMFQVGRSNLKPLGVTADEVQTDLETCTRTAVRLMKISFGVCRGRDQLDALGHYASGGETCGGLRESRHRVTKARWLFANVPFTPDPVQTSLLSIP